MKESGLARSILFPAILLLAAVPNKTYPAQQQTPRQKLRENAWNILWTGTHSSDKGQRSKAVAALGLLQPSPEVVQLAEDKLRDPEPAVRSAAATALGEMNAVASGPKLRKALKDNNLSVALAAARSLLLMKKQVGYRVYYEVLTGKRESGQGLLQQQINQLDSPKKFAEFAFDQGIGFLPYAGYGVEILQALSKKSDAPLRAAAAGILTHDPNPRSGRALAAACTDKDWIVRVAALKAIAVRGDPAFLPQVKNEMTDRVDIVRYTAAAAILRLTWPSEGTKVAEQQ